jgi:hypothetical protein
VGGNVDAFHRRTYHLDDQREAKRGTETVWADCLSVLRRIGPRFLKTFPPRVPSGLTAPQRALIGGRLFKANLPIRSQRTRAVPVARSQSEAGREREDECLGMVTVETRQKAKGEKERAASAARRMISAHASIEDATAPTTSSPMERRRWTRPNVSLSSEEQDVPFPVRITASVHQRPLTHSPAANWCNAC